MRKLLVTPEQANYGVEFGNEVLSAQLSGGASRTRRDFIGAVATVTVSWTIGINDARYLQAFYRTATANASLPFLIDLVLDNPDLSEYQAKFVPGTFKLNGVSGLTTSYSANLEVKPHVPDVDDDNLLMDAYEAFGDESVFDFFDLLADFVNVQFPAAFPG